jgi:hypothetical protein
MPTFKELKIGSRFVPPVFLDVTGEEWEHRTGLSVVKCRVAPAPCGGIYNAVVEKTHVIVCIPDDVEVSVVDS